MVKSLEMLLPEALDQLSAVEGRELRSEPDHRERSAAERTLQEPGPAIRRRS